MPIWNSISGIFGCETSRILLYQQHGGGPAISPLMFSICALGGYRVFKRNSIQGFLDMFVDSLLYKGWDDHSHYKQLICVYYVLCGKISVYIYIYCFFNLCRPLAHLLPGNYRVCHVPTRCWVPWLDYTLVLGASQICHEENVPTVPKKVDFWGGWCEIPTFDGSEIWVTSYNLRMVLSRKLRLSFVYIAGGPDLRISLKKISVFKVVTQQLDILHTQGIFIHIVDPGVIRAYNLCVLPIVFFGSTDDSLDI